MIQTVGGTGLSTHSDVHDEDRTHSIQSDHCSHGPHPSSPSQQGSAGVVQEADSTYTQPPHSSSPISTTAGACIIRIACLQ